MPVCAASLRCYAAAVERSGRRLMIHANFVEGGVFFGVAALTLLLMMFLYAVITADPEEAARTEASLMQSAVLPPPALPARGAQTLAPPVSPTEAGPGDLLGWVRCASHRPDPGRSPRRGRHRPRLHRHRHGPALAAAALAVPGTGRAAW